MSAELTLFATSDLHGYRILELPEILRATPGTSIWVDNGDLFGGLSALAYQLQGEGRSCGSIDWLAEHGAVAMNVGNHDLDGGITALLARSRQRDVALLSANLWHDHWGLLPASRTVDTLAGRVGFAGGLTAAAGAMWRPALRAHLRTTDPVAALISECRRLRPRCDWVVALAHLGLPLPLLLPGEPGPQENPGASLVAALAARGPGGRPLADCVVLGHTHEHDARILGATAVVTPGRRGDALGRVCLSRGSTPPTATLLSCHAAASPEDPRVARTGHPFPLAEARRLGRFAAQRIRVPRGTHTLGDQIREASAHFWGAPGALLAERIAPDGPPVETIGEAIRRIPMLEPFVVLELHASPLRQVRRLRDQHAAWARTRDPRIARRHRWHAFREVGPAQGRVARLVVPAGWAAGQGGYLPLLEAKQLADPGWSLVQLLVERTHGAGSSVAPTGRSRATRSDPPGPHSSVPRSAPKESHGPRR